MKNTLFAALTEVDAMGVQYSDIHTPYIVLVTADPNTQTRCMSMAPIGIKPHETYAAIQLVLEIPASHTSNAQSIH